MEVIKRGSFTLFKRNSVVKLPGDPALVEAQESSTDEDVRKVQFAPEDPPSASMEGELLKKVSQI
jgi:hypothetical protein